MLRCSILLSRHSKSCIPLICQVASWGTSALYQHLSLGGTDWSPNSDWGYSKVSGYVRNLYIRIFTYSALRGLIHRRDASQAVVKNHVSASRFADSRCDAVMHCVSRLPPRVKVESEVDAGLLGHFAGSAIANPHTKLGQLWCSSRVAVEEVRLSRPTVRHHSCLEVVAPGLGVLTIRTNLTKII